MQKKKDFTVIRIVFMSPITHKYRDTQCFYIFVFIYELIDFVLAVILEYIFFHFFTANDAITGSTRPPWDLIVDHSIDTFLCIGFLLVGLVSVAIVYRFTAKRNQVSSRGFTAMPTRDIEDSEHRDIELNTLHAIDGSSEEFLVTSGADSGATATTTSARGNTMPVAVPQAVAINSRLLQHASLQASRQLACKSGSRDGAVNSMLPAAKAMRVTSIASFTSAAASRDQFELRNSAAATVSTTSHNSDKERDEIKCSNSKGDDLQELNRSPKKHKTMTTESGKRPTKHTYFAI